MRSAIVSAVATVVLTIASGAAAQGVGTSPTFNGEVAQILYDNCVECHRAGEVAPMSLLTYTDARPWARSIKAKVESREMPPWFADDRYGSFRNARVLSTEDLETIAAWADAGAPQGDGPVPAPPDFIDGWHAFMGREPDAVIEMPIEFEVPAEGEIPNFTMWGENPFTEDKFIEAVELRPSNRAVTHHSSVGSRTLPPGARLGRGPAWKGGPIIDAALIRPDKDAPTGDVNEVAAAEAPPAGARRSARTGQTGGFGNVLLFYVPGGGYQKFRSGMAKRLYAGDAITWGVHYTVTGKPETGRHKLGLWFSREPVTHEVVTSAVLGSNIVEREQMTNLFGTPVIPPFADDWKITSIQAVQDDVTITGLWPHMHLRGKDMTFVVTYPDGREEIILSVPRYDFNWQLQYEFTEPLKVPAGSTIKAVTHYDNSIRNRYNPAPDKEVYWSEQSWDEMFLPFLELTVDKNDLLRKQPATQD